MKQYLKKQLSIVIFLYFGQISVGYFAWTSSVIMKLQDPDETPLHDVINDSQASLFGSSALLGLFLGANVSSWISNTFGRKPCFLFGGIVAMASYLLLISADEFWMLIIGRILGCLGVGIINVTNPIYIAEIVSTNIRGMFVSATESFSALGMLLAFAVSPYISYTRVMHGGFLFGLVFCIGALFVPETPAFLLLKDKEIEAKATLVKLGRSNDVEEVLSTKLSRQKTRVQEWKDVFIVKSNRKALFICLVLNLGQQLSGYLPVIMYSTTIFQSVNSSIDPRLASIAVGVTQLFGSCLPPLLVERVGRKMLLLTTCALCSVSLVVFALHFHLDNNKIEIARQLHWIPLATLLTFLISYQSGLGIIPGVYLSEMFDSSTRGPGASIITSASMIVGFVITSTYSFMILALGSHGTFFIFSGACALVCVFTSVFVIETKGMEFAEVQLLLSK